jgi:hypothetical protein
MMMMIGLHALRETDWPFFISAGAGCRAVMAHPLSPDGEEIAVRDWAAGVRVSGALPEVLTQLPDGIDFPFLRAVPSLWPVVLTQGHLRCDNGAKFAVRVHFVLAFGKASLYGGQRVLVRESAHKRHETAQFLFAVGGDTFLFGTKSFYGVVLTEAGKIEMILLEMKKTCRLEISTPLEHAPLSFEVVNAGLAFVAEQLVNRRHKFRFAEDADSQVKGKLHAVDCLFV